MTVWGRGVNASVVESDIGTVNGVVHIIDRVLGVPYMTIGEYMESDPDMRYKLVIIQIFDVLKQVLIVMRSIMIRRILFQSYVVFNETTKDGPICIGRQS